METGEKNFVSRGGIKLQSALNLLNMDVSGLTVMDVGSSTGGFVDCLLQNNAAKVYSVDTSYGELAWKLRNDPRVVVMERTNILHLNFLTNPHPTSPLKRGGDGSQVPSPLQREGQDGVDSDKVDLITIDASWTKLEKILPVVRKFLKPDGVIIALLKPHYQADRKDLNKGVLSVEQAEKIKDLVVVELRVLKFETEKIVDSPILGGAGNKEYLMKIKPVLPST